MPTDGVCYSRMSSRTILYRVWGQLPGRLQALLQYLLTPKITLGVSAVVTDAGGRVLLVRHTYRRPAWDLPSGLVERGEQPDAAVARELREELGLVATVGPLLHADRRPHRHHLTLYYSVRIEGTPHQDGVEIDAVRYVAPDDLPSVLGTNRLPWLPIGRGP